jgi:CRP/FNR family transcriptional regulator
MNELGDPIHQASPYRSSSGRSAVRPDETLPMSGRIWSGLSEICDLLHIQSAVTAEDLLFPHIRYKVGQRIYTAGQEFESLFIVRSGFLKSQMCDDFGNEQVLHFPMEGDLLGADGIHTGRHQSEAVALTDCVVIPVRFKKFLSLAKTCPEFEIALCSYISRDLIGKYSMVRLLSGLNAEMKVAYFLISLSQRYADLGYSNKCFNLRMTRQDMGNYLGLSLETVCRMLTGLGALRLISVDQREIVIHDVEGLKSLRRLKLPQKEKMRLR